MTMNPALGLYRIGNTCYRHKLFGVSALISKLNRFLFAVWIPSSATIGKNFILGYGGLGVVIHSDTKIGDNCLVAQNVTIGRKFEEIEVPRLGNYVYVGAGSVIVGNITIGDNVIIGANSFVNKSIPSNCTVVGNPMRIVKTDRRETYKELDCKIHFK